ATERRCKDHGILKLRGNENWPPIALAEASDQPLRFAATVSRRCIEQIEPRIEARTERRIQVVLSVLLAVPPKGFPPATGSDPQSRHRSPSSAKCSSFKSHVPPQSEWKKPMTCSFLILPSSSST